VVDQAGRMTLMEPFDELRTRLVRCLLAVTAAAVVAFWQIEAVMVFMRGPLTDAIARYDNLELIQTKAHGAFVASMAIAFFTGCVVAAPLIVHQIWAFIAAGLYRHERRAVKYYAIPGVLLFFAGAALAYWFVLPWAFLFLIGYSETLGVKSLLDLNGYLALVAFAMFVFGLMFQLPLVMVFLMRLGVVEPDTFKRFRRHAIVVSFGLAMILTPPDVVSQIALAGCMSLLYEGAILVGRRVSQPRDTETDRRDR